MPLYSGRNAVVHPCKTSSMFPLWLVGEGTNFENAFFFKILCVIFEVFRPAGATYLTDVNEIWRDERD